MRKLQYLIIIGVVITIAEALSCCNNAKPRKSTIGFDVSKPLIEQKAFHEFDSAGIKYVREMCASIDSDRIYDYNFFTAYNEWHADSDFEYKSVIEGFIRDFTSDLLTLREAKEWDEMKGNLIIRDAEMDTFVIVNHIRIRFTTDK